MLTRMKVLGLTIAALVILTVAPAASTGHAVAEPSGLVKAMSAESQSRPSDIASAKPCPRGGRTFSGAPTIPLMFPSSDAENVELVGSIDTPGYAYGVAIAEDHAFIADSTKGLRVVDISDPANPFEVGHYNTPDEAMGVTLADSYAYVADGWAGLRVIDISNPTSPDEVGFYDAPHFALSLAVAGEYAYVANGIGNLQVVDISDPTDPCEVGHYDGEGDGEAVAVLGDHAYVAQDWKGLRVYDISDPANPSEVGYYDTSSYAKDVAVSGDYTYVADWSSGLQVIDVSDPTNPSAAGSYDTPWAAMGVAVAGNYAHVVGWTAYSGLHVMDVSNPANPTEAGYYDYMVGNAEGVAVVEGYTYVAGGSGGLFILRFTSEEPTYSVSGHVTDGDSNPISGVKVLVGTGDFAATDASGTYTITNLVAGTYVLTAHKSDYRFSPSARIVRLPPDTTGQDFTTIPVYGSLTGQITDQASGTAIANARISAAGKVTRSDVSGNYTLTDILPGRRNVYVSADGYEDYKGEVVIEADTSIVKNATLEPIKANGYYLPYPGGETYQCTQGNGGQYSHQGIWYYAFDFGMPNGHKVAAAQGGRVAAVKEDSNTSCNTKACINDANYIRIRHQDGTDTLYYHLKYQSVSVNVGDTVVRGQVIAQSDTTGWCTGPHLDFTRHKWGQWHSIPISFADVPGDGVPKTYGWYTSDNYAASATTMSETVADTDPSEGSVQFHLTGESTHNLRLSAFDYAADVIAMRLAATKYNLQAATWLSYTTRTVWTEPAVFAQFKDSNGNVSAVVSDTVDAIAYEAISAAFAVSPTVCVGRGLSLTNKTTPFCEQCGWLWSFGDGTTSKAAEPEFDYAAKSSFAGYASPNTYTVTLTVTNAISTSTVSHQVEALSAPAAEFSLVRSGAIITVEAEATDAAGWTWDFGDGVTATGRIATHTYTGTALLTHYPVHLEVQGTNGCTNWRHQYVPAYSVYLPLVLRNH